MYDFVPTSLHCIIYLIIWFTESKQQSEQQEQQATTAATDREEGVEISKITTAADILQQLQSSKTVEMVCSMQNIVNALHAIIVSSVSIQ